MSLVLLFSVCWLGLVMAQDAQPLSLINAEAHFELFIQQHGRQYADEIEKQFRFQIFKENLAIAIDINEGREFINYVIPKFFDLTLEEFHQSYTGFIPSLPTRRSDRCTIINDDQIEDVDAPESFDWRDHNAVTPVKRQRCSDCYTFSSVGNIEGQYAIKYKKLVDLSSQQLLDCDRFDGGCNGGLMANAFSWLMVSGGSESLADYPYLGRRGYCRTNPYKRTVKVKECHRYNLKSQEKLKQLLYQNGPISIAVRSDGLQQYVHQHRVVRERDCQQGRVNHAVLLVGYGQDNATGEQYWIVKNSWGADWCEQGYFRIHRGEGAFSCGMLNAEMASAVIE